MKQQGKIVAAFGRHYLAALPGGEMLECVPRGKKSEVACGDEVEITKTGADQGVIERILPRRSLLYRSVAHREKLIAANVTQLIAVVATMGYSFVGTLIILKVLDVIPGLGLRATERDEDQGLDLAAHGESAFVSDGAD